jgi:hypothetical protein
MTKFLHFERAAKLFKFIKRNTQEFLIKRYLISVFNVPVTVVYINKIL